MTLVVELAMAVVAGVELLQRDAPSDGGRDGAGEAVVEEVDAAMGLSWRRTRWPRAEREPPGERDGHDAAQLALDARPGSEPAVVPGAQEAVGVREVVLDDGLQALGDHDAVVCAAAHAQRWVVRR